MNLMDDEVFVYCFGVYQGVNKVDVDCLPAELKERVHHALVPHEHVGVCMCAAVMKFPELSFERLYQAAADAEVVYRARVLRQVDDIPSQSVLAH